MILIKNENFSNIYYSNEDIYLLAFTHEERSTYQYNKLSTNIDEESMKIFSLQNVMQNGINHIVEDIKSEVFKLTYSDIHKFKKHLLEIVLNKQKTYNSIRLHIDYSSMPRSWYCSIPSILSDKMRSGDKVYFWYTEGEYPDCYEKYPSAGIETFDFFSGRPSLKVNNRRAHILALGFDVVRSEAIEAIIDPEYLVACYAYNPKREGFLEHIKEVNEHQLAQAAMRIGMNICDYSYMIAKLKEIVNELLIEGDVVLIPDGPKPLIFAMSLIPDLIEKQGITVLHVSKNKLLQDKINVKPTGAIHGFSINY